MFTRCAFYKLAIFLGLVVGTAAGQQRINPHINVNWPASCAAPGMVYNFQANACIAIGGLNWRGAWSAGTYTTNDVVSYLGSSYISTAAANTTTPPSATWSILAQGGATGPPGPTFNGGTITNPLIGTSAAFSSVNSSVNTQVSVMSSPYNAVGDCVTDDSTAFQNAQTAALASTPQKTLYLPTPPGGCYLIPNFTWQGASFLGASSQGNTPRVVLKGGPGQDVLHPSGDIATNPTWRNTWSIDDVTITVDNSAPCTGAWNSNCAHRWPGIWFDSGSMTAGSAVFSYTGLTRIISCADVGQAIMVTGAGAGGSNLVTTIASVSPCFNKAWQTVTLTDAASTTVTGAHTYKSVLGLSTTTNVGPCGIAFDNQDANTAHWANPGFRGNIYNHMHRVLFNTSTNNNLNNSCALFLQGTWGMYGVDVREFAVRNGVFGFVQGCSELATANQQCSADFEKWDHGSIESVTNPWISYGGSWGVFTDVELSSPNGPQWRNEPLGAPQSWKVDVGEFELNTTYGFVVDGRGHFFTNTVLAGPPVGIKAYWEADVSKCVNCLTNGGTLYVDGYNNAFSMRNDILNPISDRGLGNTIDFGFTNSGLRGVPNPILAGNERKTDTNVRGVVPYNYVRDGNYLVGYNLSDLWIWPQEFIFNGSLGPYETFIQADATSPTGYNLSINAGIGYAQFTQFYTTDPTFDNLKVGLAIPAGKVTFSMLYKCAPGTTTWAFNIGATGFASGTQTLSSCTTSYQSYSVDLDLSAASGAVSVNGVTNSGLVAWMDFAPWPTALKTSGAVTGTSFSGNAATATKLSTNGSTGNVWSMTGASTQGWAAPAAAAPACPGEWTNGPSRVAAAVNINSLVGANKTLLYSFAMPCTGSFTKIGFEASTADNSATLYDAGIYSQSGTAITLVCDLGPLAGTSFAPDTAWHDHTFLSACSLTGGVRYLLGLTSATPVAVFYGTGGTPMGYAGSASGSSGNTTGGQLNSTAVVFADSWQSINSPLQFALHN